MMFDIVESPFSGSVRVVFWFARLSVRNYELKAILREAWWDVM
jgi:hypothetical protein